MKVVGLRAQPLVYFRQNYSKQAWKITLDTYVLHPEFELLPSGRRFGSLRFRRNRYKNSFVPLAIRLLNSSTKTFDMLFFFYLYVQNNSKEEKK